LVRLFRKCLAFFICAIGVLLPWRARIIFSEILGWITQFIYLNYIVILKFIINELEKTEKQKIR
jgi:hypothetical protein